MCWCSFWKNLCCCSRYQLTPEDKNKKSLGQRRFSEPDLTDIRKFRAPPYFFLPPKHFSDTTPTRRQPLLTDSGTPIDRFGRDQGDRPSTSFKEVGPQLPSLGFSGEIGPSQYGSIQNEELVTEEAFKKIGRPLVLAEEPSSRPVSSPRSSRPLTTHHLLS